MKYLYATLILFFLCGMTRGQDGSGQYSHAELNRMAEGSLRNNDVHSAIRYYSELAEAKTDNYKLLRKLAELEESVRNYQSALELYERCLVLDEDRHPENLYRKAELLKSLGRYAEARTAYNEFISKFKRLPELKELKKEAELAVKGCDTAEIFMTQQLNVSIQRLPDAINGPHIEFNPLPINDRTLVFGALPEKTVKTYHIDSIHPSRKFFWAELTNEGWINRGEWGEVLNSELEDTGNGCFNSDSSLFVFSKCTKNWKGELNCKLYQASYVNGKVVETELLDEGINFPGTSNTQPCFGTESKNGAELLYFVSDREGGRGGMDIWVSLYDERRRNFKAPKNLGRKINSENDELTPYYDNNKRKLFFSSNASRGLGGFDVFEVRGDYRTWTRSKNVGYPINTHADELYFRFGKDGSRGFFTSNRSGSSQMFHPTCCDDIYEFEFRDFIFLGIEGKIVEIPDSLYLKGSGDGLDELSGLELLEGAEVKLYLLEDGSEILMSTIETGENGEYYIQLEAEKEYRIEVSKERYFSNFVEMSTVNRTYSDSITVNVGLSKLEEKGMVVPNIYYEFDSSELTEEAKQSLNSSIFAMLIENPSFKIELSSHTDNRGADSYNLKLSQERAQSAVDHLISKGIDRNRLVAKGYGETQPIAPNTNPDGSDNPEGRQRNRRTEFKVIGYEKPKIVFD